MVLVLKHTSIFMKWKRWIGMDLTWNMKMDGYKGWYEIDVHDGYYLIVWACLVCGQHVIP